MSISKTVDTLVKNIIALREARGWNKSDLARKCEVDASYISRIENADRYVGIESIEKIALALDVEFFELFKEQDAETYMLHHKLEQLKSLHPLKKEMIITMIDAFVREQEMEK